MNCAQADSGSDGSDVTHSSDELGAMKELQSVSLRKVVF